MQSKAETSATTLFQLIHSHFQVKVCGGLQLEHVTTHLHPRTPTSEATCKPCLVVYFVDGTRSASSEHWVVSCSLMLQVACNISKAVFY